MKTRTISIGQWVRAFCFLPDAEPLGSMRRLKVASLDLGWIHRPLPGKRLMPRTPREAIRDIGREVLCLVMEREP